MVLVLALMLADSGSAAVLCVSKKGSVRRRESACKPREQPLDLAEFGAAGPKGDQGDPGPVGPSGVIATGFAAFRYEDNNSAVMLPQDGSAGDVIDLNSGGRHSGPLVVDAPARLIVSGAAHLSNQDGVGRAFDCQIELRPGGGSPEPVGFETSDTLESFAPRTWSLTAAIDVDPATYNVALKCLTRADNPGGRVYSADLTVTAHRR